MMDTLQWAAIAVLASFVWRYRSYQRRHIDITETLAKAVMEGQRNLEARVREAQEDGRL